jgi:MoxR-like ATPase
MSTLQKRDVLRYSGLSELPRPREGEKALDAALLDLMDDAVRGEYLRLKERKSSSYKKEESPVNTDSAINSRQSLLQAMAEALESGDRTSAEAFRDRFTLLTMLKADPTQARGSYQEYLDQDEWYMIERRKAMGIPASKMPTTKKLNPE